MGEVIRLRPFERLIRKRIRLRNRTEECHSRRVSIFCVFTQPGSFASFLTYLQHSAIRPTSDLQYGVANTEIGVIQAPEPGPRIMRHELTDFEWTAIRPFLPNKSRGVPRVNDRRVLNGIFWILRSVASWRDLPDSSGPYTTCYNRFVRWRMAGI
jgi:Putative transposase of IS4/5 family (DUF4096)